MQTDSFYLNDRWDMNAHWTFNIGGRYEITTSESTGGIQGIDTKGFAPRLAASFDPMANGKYKFDVTYAEYTGRYNPSILGRNTPRRQSRAPVRLLHRTAGRRPQLRARLRPEQLRLLVRQRSDRKRVHVRRPLRSEQP